MVGKADEAEVARQLGAHIVVDRSEQDFVDVVKDATGGRGAGLHWGLYLKKAPELVAGCHTELTRMDNEALIRPLISEEVPLEKGAEALQRLADGETVGRVALLG